VVAEVIGVAGDVRMNALGSTYALAMYTPYQVMAQPVMRVAVRAAGDPAAVAPALRAALSRRDRGLVLAEVQTMEAILASSVRGYRLRPAPSCSSARPPCCSPCLVSTACWPSP